MNNKYFTKINAGVHIVTGLSLSLCLLASFVLELVSACLVLKRENFLFKRMIFPPMMFFDDLFTKRLQSKDPLMDKAWPGQSQQAAIDSLAIQKAMPL